MDKFLSFKPFRFFTKLGWPILFLGISTTAFITTYIYITTKDEDRMRFEYEADQAIKRILYRMERYEGALIQTRAFILSSKDVSREEFHHYFNKTRLLERYPGILGLGIAAKVDPGDVHSYTKKMKKEVDPNFQIFPFSNRDVYFAIQYLEPMSEENKRVLGYDMYTESIREEAMKRAWKSGLPAISGKIILVQDQVSTQQPGFNFYIPFYTEGVPLHTEEDRRKNLLGFIYSPFRTNDLFQAIFDDVKLDLDIEIFDGPKMNEAALLFDYDKKPRFKRTFKRNDLRIIKQIVIAGRTFTLHFVPSPKFKHKYSFYLPLLTALAGLFITLLICRIFWITKRQADLSNISEEALRDAVQSRDEFLSIASHELKTPLTSLKLQTQVSKRSIEKGDPEALKQNKIKNFVNQVERQTLRLERLVDDMLDISRIRTGRLTIEKEKFDFCELVRDIISRMSEQFSSIPDGAPKVSYCRDSSGVWDRIRIEQVITNLLTNAIKYGNNDVIEVKVESTPQHVTLKVIDKGIGISSEFQDKVFNRFERAGVPAKEISGLGLGLFITKQIVLAHRGKIWVESQKGEGSTFIVELPRFE